jgi:hypothetical protein
MVDKKKKLTKAEERRLDKARDEDMRYISGSPPLFLPDKIPKGRILAHNHVMHTIDMPEGLNGFRCWTWREDLRPDNFVPCPCGWAGLPHYASREHIKTSGGKCETEKHFERRMGMTMAEILLDMNDGGWTRITRIR